MTPSCAQRALRFRTIVGMVQRMRRVLILVVCVGFGLSRPVAAQSCYDIKQLGDLDLGQSYGNAINANGDVVGIAFSTTAIRAFRWTDSGGIQDLGTLGGDIASAAAISDTGQVVGYSTTSFGVPLPFTWTSGQGMTALDVYSGYANGVNACGTAVGYENPPPYPNYAHAWLWDGTEFGRDLGTGSGVGTVANAISETNVVVGFSFDALYRTRAALWTGTGGWQDLGTLGGSQSDARAVKGDFIVGASLTAGDTFPYAFRWTATGGMQNLGVPAGAQTSIAFGVANDGRVVGYTSDCTPLCNDHRAALWSDSGGWRDLTGSLLPGHGWDTLTWATGINDSGQISGFGWKNGSYHAFRLTPASCQ